MVTMPTANKAEAKACTVRRYPHAYLVRGTTSIDTAREVMRREGLCDDYAAMPIQFNGKPCVGMYFHASGDFTLGQAFGPKEKAKRWGKIKEGK